MLGMTARLPRKSQTHFSTSRQRVGRIAHPGTPKRTNQKHNTIMPSYTANKPAQSEFFVPPGDYKLEVVDATEETSKGGNEMIKLKLRVINKDGGKGPSLFDYLVFAPSSFWKIDAFRASCGEDVEEGAEANIEASELIGNVCEATLIVETYDGQKSNKVKSYLFDKEGF